MHSTDQAVFALEVVLALGPLAVYFLGLGLVNSQAHPCLVKARVDFAVLAIAFVPLMAAPVVALVEREQYALSATVTVGWGGLFMGMMPRHASAWVIYNIGPGQCRRLIKRACGRCGWSVTSQEDHIRVAPVGLTVTQSALPWLRNVTVRIEHDGVGAGDEASDALVSALGREIRRESMLPSPTGASLVVIGVSLLGMPMWYLFRHMEAIVEIVRQILLA